MLDLIGGVVLAVAGLIGIYSACRVAWCRRLTLLWFGGDATGVNGGGIGEIVVRGDSSPLERALGFEPSSAARRAHDSPRAESGSAEPRRLSALRPMAPDRRRGQTARNLLFEHGGNHGLCEQAPFAVRDPSCTTLLYPPTPLIRFTPPHDQQLVNEPIVIADPDRSDRPTQTPTHRRYVG